MFSEMSIWLKMGSPLGSNLKGGVIGDREDIMRYERLHRHLKQVGINICIITFNF